MSLARSSGESDAEVIRFPLERVRPISESEATEAQAPIDLPAPSAAKLARRAHNVSMHALGTRAQSRAELASRLVSRGIPDEHVAEEIDHLEGRGLVDDRSLARDLVDKYVFRSGLGRRMVAEKLRARDIPSDVIREALDEVDDELEAAHLREAASKKLASMGSDLSPTGLRRLSAHLMRRGFDPGEVHRVVQSLRG